MNEEQLSKMERLSKLRDQGTLSPAEFEQQKTMLLGNTTPRITIKNGPESPASGPLGVFLLLVGALILSSIIGKIFGETEPKTKEEVRTEAINRLFSGYDGSHQELERAIKRTMDDPHSYEHIETHYRDDGNTIYVITKFRVKNAYGGIVTKMAGATIDGTSGRVLEWKMLD